MLGMTDLTRFALNVKMTHVITLNETYIYKLQYLEMMHVEGSRFTQFLLTYMYGVAEAKQLTR